MLEREAVGTGRPGDEAGRRREEQGEEDAEQQALEQPLRDAGPPHVRDVAPAEDGDEVERADAAIDGVRGRPQEAARQDAGDGDRRQVERPRSGSALGIIVGHRASPHLLILGGSIADRLVHDVQQHLARGEAAEVLAEDLVAAAIAAGRLAGACGA